MVYEKKENIILELYKNTRTVFRINDIALIMGKEKTDALHKLINYYVRSGKLLNPRRGFYAKTGYKSEELACLLYPPTYISLGYVLQRSGVIFQYYSAITNVSYLSREIEIDNQTFCYRQVKGEILVNTDGILLNENNINIATPERAFLDMLYLNSHYYFDNLHILDKKKVTALLSVFRSPTLEKRVKKLFENDKYH